ncbi:helicase HerA-like domain-containing protein [Mammaliicoccus sp. Dog046]|uniref:helicase HerA-like domain-containing protein n=1 Tax=Mammaliicoccus sp. Dog046 TaxID=3034233 RepID=UPI002B25C9E4|nr:helicase HerA-like domain-containing protein [Mammaliicoccus sp. Dog046]WQK86243.1 helicase HerA-like domain-containing protein [Mammaliicoccus sp. Dog046]
MTQLNIAKNETEVNLELGQANRHGLIAGATGTGKTITLKVLAEQFSKAGVPVFMSDVKGDISSIAEAGTINDKIQERLDQLKIDDYENAAYPVTLFDVFQKNGVPVRTTITEMGPLLIGKLLDLNNTQLGVLDIVFKVADESGLLLIDMKDFKALLKEINENRAEYSEKYGNISSASIGAIQRSLLRLESEGAETFFGEPALELEDFIKIDENGKGMINVLDASVLYQKPKLYATFLLWLLSELFESLPEVGDPEKPKIVFFFDEAHLLFNDSSKELIEKVEQVVRLIRSKGVGIYFVTQNPIDIPESILGQLGNRVQHALRSYTPKDQKAIKSAAQTFRQNEAFDTATVIGELKTGEALISFLNDEGQPNIVERAFIRPPESKIGVIDEKVKQDLITNAPLNETYKETFDRESAFEMLQKKIEAQPTESEEKPKKEKTSEKQSEGKEKKKQSQFQKETSKMLSSVGRQIGREIVRNIFGTKRR